MKKRRIESKKTAVRNDGIAYQNKDIISKMFSQKLSNKALEVYGIHIPRIVGTESTNLPVIRANELRIDDIFLLEDGSIAILDYESSYRKRNKIKYMDYIIRVLQRHLEQTGEFLQVRMIVFYTADVTADMTEEVLDAGSLVLTLQQAFLVDMDSDKIYQEIKQKVQEGQELTEEDKMRLILYPLTYQGDKGKQEAIERAVGLAESMQKQEDATYILSGLVAFSDKVIVTIQSHADLYKIGCSSLLDKDYFYKSIWRDAIMSKSKASKRRFCEWALNSYK